MNVPKFDWPFLDKLSETKPLTIYVAGPMTGLPDFNRETFFKVATRLRAVGYLVMSPAEYDEATYGPDVLRSATGDPADAIAKGFSLNDALAFDLAYICQQADGVALLEGWSGSKGAQLEKATAEALGKPVRPWQVWVEEITGVEVKPDPPLKVPPYVAEYRNAQETGFRKGDRVANKFGNEGTVDQALDGVTRPIYVDWETGDSGWHEPEDLTRVDDYGLRDQDYPPWLDDNLVPLSFQSITRSDVLTKAEGLINGARDEEYGAALENFRQIGVAWGLDLDIPAIDPWRVALMMSSLKHVRTRHNPKKADSWIDGAGYLALGAETAGAT